MSIARPTDRERRRRKHKCARCGAILTQWGEAYCPPCYQAVEHWLAVKHPGFTQEVLSSALKIDFW